MTIYNEDISDNAYVQITFETKSTFFKSYWKLPIKFHFAAHFLSEIAKNAFQLNTTLNPLAITWYNHRAVFRCPVINRVWMRLGMTLQDSVLSQNCGENQIWYHKRRLNWIQTTAITSHVRDEIIRSHCNLTPLHWTWSETLVVTVGGTPLLAMHKYSPMCKRLIFTNVRDSPSTAYTAKGSH